MTRTNMQKINIGFLAASVIATPGAIAAFGPTSAAQATDAVFTSDGTWTVPAGVTAIDVVAEGADGGIEPGCSSGAFGARVTATVPVTPGMVLDINIGGAGGSPTADTGGVGGTNGGGAGGTGPSLNGTPQGSGAAGGGGATDIRVGGTALSNRILVAAGGGGAGITEGYLVGDCFWSNGAWGGRPDEGNAGFEGEIGGGGGKLTTGGFAGVGGGSSSGSVGSLALGGNGGSGGLPGGGGGGGYYGGGGGGACDPADETWCPADYAGGGGGGSSYVAPSITKTFFGLNSGVGGTLSITKAVAPPPPRLATTPRNSCAIFPRRIPRIGAVPVLKPNCLTTSSQQVRVTARVTGVPAGRRYVAFTCRAPRTRPTAPSVNALGAWCRVGNLTLATLTGKKLNLLLTWRAAGTSRTYPYYTVRGFAV